jgi:hypothetical protein
MSRYKKFEMPEGWYALRELPKGEFVKKTPGSRKVYRKGVYDKATRQYELDDMDDISNYVLVKPGALVWAGFTY